nr:retrotransposon protein, putative, Ty1-copia subclass [Tanacetum cinerariifolium]
MVPTKKVDKTPYEIWHGKAPDFSFLKETIGYYFYFPLENKVIVARYGNFLERDLISQKFSGRDNDLEDDHMDTLPSENTSEIPIESESLGSPLKLIPVRRLKEVKDYLRKFFSMKDLGEAAYIMGIKIYRDRSRRLIRFSQSAYIDKILKKCNMHNSKKGYLPMEVKHDLSNELCASTPEEVAYMKKVPYALAVGSIMYDVRCTRPNVVCAQNLVSRYQLNLGKLHWVAVKHILKYLRNTRDVFLVYGGKPDTELDVTSFCDASWQCDKDDTKSQTGYVFVINGGAVDWKSKKQTTIALHSAQPEYVATSEAAMEAVWIRKFVGDRGVMSLINKPINMYCDNSAAIIFANEPRIMKGAKHFLRRYHYVRE